jgi:hypothetical protein
MERLENKGIDYYIKGQKVRPILVAGPIQFSYEFPEGQDPDAFLNASLEKITGKAIDKLSLPKVPDAYLFRGLTVREPEQIVADGVVPARNMRHGFIMYFRTEILI